MATSTVTHARLLEVVRFIPEQGVLVWRKARKKCRPGSVIGTPHKNGATQATIDGKRYLVHRLIWFYVHGTWPPFDIDHRLGTAAGNKLDNLREATRSENMQNLRCATRRSKSRVLGVWWSPDRRKWCAQITVNKQRHDLGRYKTRKEAKAAYLKAKAALHPFSTVT